MTNSYLALEGVSFHLPDGTPLFRQLNETFDTRATGLVGRNGVGKSVLSRIMAGQLSPSSGRCTRSGAVYYLAQQIHYPEWATVASLAGVQPLVDALGRIEQGSTSEKDFDTVGQRWDIHQQLNLELERCGLGHLDSLTPAVQLSGGEAIRASLAGAWLSCADFLILDEPSNHLDRTSRLSLISQLARWRGGLLVVSHDRGLLESMERIVELTPSGLNSYGGKYSFYARQKKQETQSALLLLEQRKQERQREKKVLCEQRERLEKRQSHGNRQGREANQANILLGGQKQRSENSAGKLKQRHQATQVLLDERVREAAAAIDEDTAIALRSLEVNAPSRRRVAELDAVQLPFVPPFTPPINLMLTTGQRIGVVGRNGRGKSTLLKVMAGQTQPLSGNCWITANYAWLDQRLMTLDPRRTVLEQMQEANRTSGEGYLRTRLAQLGLDAEKIRVASGLLSGGEQLKAALACVLYVDPVPELLLLDEPSNHLDLTSLYALESMLSGYQGALMVVSHDEVFLNNLNLTGRLLLEESCWQLQAQ